MVQQLFKWLMALVVMFCVPMLFEACKGFGPKEGAVNGGSDDNTPAESPEAEATDSEAASKSEEAVRQRVTDIYAMITSWYNTVDSIENVSEAIPFEELPERTPSERFCSEDWCATEVVLDSIDRIVTEQCDMGFYDMDYWIGAQDFEKIWVTDIAVDSLRNNTAYASLKLHNGEQMTVNYRLRMAYERDNWFIDEMWLQWSDDPGDTLAVKSEMKRYIDDYNNGRRFEW